MFFADDDYNEAEANPADKEQIELAVNKVLCKSKPSYNWNFAQELMRREHNLFNRIGWRGGHTTAMSFGQGYYGSRQVVERMKLLNALSMHRCCVNCLSFNRSGDLICSGSDDLSIIVWDWANGRPRHSFKSGHSLNIFQTKFIDSVGCLDVVSSSRDGQVRRAVIPPSGSSSIKPVRLYSHNDAVHKLVVVPQSKHEVISAGEDAAVKHFDLRTNACTTMLRCVSSDDNRRVRLFSIAHHPYAPEFCVSGSDDKLRVYDKRKLTSPIHEMTPKDLKDVSLEIHTFSPNCDNIPPFFVQTKITQITCAVYNHSGSEILASYSDAGIYLYDSRNYKDGEFLHSYEGHINSRTIKGVNFFGPHSEYIISGSDCGNIFFWDKNTEAVINFVKGDHAGVVNCLEQHPSMPVLATSGLDHNVKIWTPSGLSEAEVPRTDALKETLQRNFRRSLLDVGDFDINQIHYFIRQLIEPRRSAAGAAAGGGEQGPRERNRNLFRSSSSSSSSSISSSPAPAANNQAARTRDSNPSSSDEGNADPLGCRSQ
ncbi:DDB1- and CUL4-associated factor 8 isoform X2 [Drosophila montana]|uniref:DDB1- and CUL4-associated factor 8 isoform X2 n=1 Tax=Drosophila montana TaxID=40370 RepID=UPI00313D25BF